MTNERKERIAALMPGLVRDLASLAGICLLSYGGWLVYKPAGFICCGAIFLVGGIVASRSAALRDREASERKRTAR
jgi:hypothetical protein